MGGECERPLKSVMWPDIAEQKSGHGASASNQLISNHSFYACMYGRSSLSCSQARPSLALGCRRRIFSTRALPMKPVAPSERWPVWVDWGQTHSVACGRTVSCVHDAAQSRCNLVCTIIVIFSCSAGCTVFWCVLLKTG